MRALNPAAFCRDQCMTFHELAQGKWTVKFDPRKAAGKVGTVERSGDKGTAGTVKQVEILAKGPRPGGLE